MEKRLVVLSGAGISAESGIKTFRDADGLWEGHQVMEVASPEGWNKNKALVLEFYNARRKQLLEVEPNEAHRILADLQNDFKVTIITQNVDDLHERAGSFDVLHLHGELLKVRSTVDPRLILDWRKDLKPQDTNELQHPLRPHIVWFGEAVEEMEKAIEIVEQADYIIVVGTSMQVYPAASLIDYAKTGTVIYYIDPKPATIHNRRLQVEVIPEIASKGMKLIREKLKELGQSL